LGGEKGLLRLILISLPGRCSLDPDLGSLGSPAQTTTKEAKSNSEAARRNASAREIGPQIQNTAPSKLMIRPAGKTMRVNPDLVSSSHLAASSGFVNRIIGLLGVEGFC